MTAYATTEQLASYLGASAPDDAERLLERASELLDQVVLAAFEVDSDTELPVDEDVALALRNAACAQVEYWQEVGEETDIDGLNGADVALGGFHTRRPQVLSPRALRYLQNAGLMAWRPGAGYYGMVGF